MSHDDLDAATYSDWAKSWSGGATGSDALEIIATKLMRLATLERAVATLTGVFRSPLDLPPELLVFAAKTPPGCEP